jgi:serine/threonine-protein kinase HipA
MTTAAVRLWGSMIGAVTVEAPGAPARFEYEREFLASGIEVSPIVMPLRSGPFSFPDLPFTAFRGLPGLLADSLPDRFGDALIDAWLAAQGRVPESFDAVERLCYTGSRGVGALEYEPTAGPDAGSLHDLNVDELVELATEALTERERFVTSLRDDRRNAVRDILRVGTSAGGARAKALVAWNRATGELRSGQLDPAPGFEHWLLKFDGVAGNRDRELETPQGFGAIEFAYARMAVAAGIEMSETHLLEDGDRRHFMTRRFDRTAKGDKLHMQSLGALAHYDFNAAGAYSYEQAFAAMRKLRLSTDEVEQQFRRMVFNVVARNQDDHVKNIAYLMNRAGVWSLAPAYDVTYAYNPDGLWTGHHQMSINGRRDDITMTDLRECARTAELRRPATTGIVADVVAAVNRWHEFAAAAGVDELQARQVASAHRLSFEN